ncbi:hypothetical protein, partial [Psychrobacter sp. TB55-MNA-CIBAN-0194]
STSLKVDEQVLEGLQRIANGTASSDEAIDEYNDDLPSVQSVSAPELQLESIDTDIELLEIFLEEAQELDDALAESFNKWRADISNINT